MSTQRVMFVILVASFVVLAVGAGPRIAGTAQALPYRQEAAAPGVTIAYPGRLSDDRGQPVVDGVYDFGFTLYAAEGGGEPLWSEVQEAIPVQAGVFAVSLGSVNPIPVATLAGDPRWLAVAVRGPAEATLTALAPRQRVSTASPGGLGSPAAASSAAAGGACPHDHLGEEWAGEAEWGLKISNPNGANGIQVTAEHKGVYAEISATSGSSAIHGRADNGSGVYGTGGFAGVYGSSPEKYGVYGSSPDGTGVYGYSPGDIGVMGRSGSEHGVYGSTDGDWGWRSGVYGEASKDHANGVTGRNTAAGPGVYGWSTDGFGVYAAGKDEANFPLYRKGDLILAGTYGDLFAPGFLRLISDSSVWVRLDANNDGGDGFYMYNGAGDHIMLVDEAGNLWIKGNLTEGTAGFQIDHPQDPENRTLSHSSVASADMKNVYDGVVVLDSEGTAWVELPAWFEALNRDFRYQLTPIGGPGPGLYIGQEIEGNRFQIAGGEPGLKVSWQVTGIRQDAYAKAHPMAVEEAKLPEEQGTYLHPTEHGKPETLRLDYQPDRAPEHIETGGE